MICGTASHAPFWPSWPADSRMTARPASAGARAHGRGAAAAARRGRPHSGLRVLVPQHTRREGANDGFMMAFQRAWFECCQHASVAERACCCVAPAACCTPAVSLRFAGTDLRAPAASRIADLQRHARGARQQANRQGARHHAQIRPPIGVAPPRHLIADLKCNPSRVVTRAISLCLSRWYVLQASTALHDPHHHCLPNLYVPSEFPNQPPNRRPSSQEFDDWLVNACTAAAGPARNRRLAAWASAPGGRGAHPREEHLLPLLVAAAAGGGDGGRAVQSSMGSVPMTHFIFG